MFAGVATERRTSLKCRVARRANVNSGALCVLTDADDEGLIVVEEGFRNRCFLECLGAVFRKFFGGDGGSHENQRSPREMIESGRVLIMHQE